MATSRTVEEAGEKKEEALNTTTEVLRQLTDLTNKLPNSEAKQDQYLTVPFYEARLTSSKKRPENLSNGLVVSAKILDQFNSRGFIYAQGKQKTIIGQTIGKKQIMFVRPWQYIPYSQLRRIQLETMSRLAIVDLGEHGFGLIAKKSIKKGEKLFYPGVLSAWQDVDLQPYAVNISLGEPEPSMTINAANCDKSCYAQHIRYTPEKNLTGNLEVSASNVKSCFYYTDIWISERRTLLPLVAMEFTHSVQPKEGIFTSSEDRYPRALDQALTLFSKTLKPIIEEVQLIVSQDNGKEIHDQFLIVNEEWMKTLIKDGYLNLKDNIAILPQQSREKLSKTYNASGFRKCNGLQLPAIIIASQKKFRISKIDNKSILVVQGSIIAKSTNQQLDTIGDVNDPNLFVPMAQLQSADQAELRELINEIAKNTGCRLKMYCDQSLMEHVSEDKKEEDSPRNTVQP